MIVLRILLLVCATIALPLQARADNPVRVVVFGDSLTAGYSLQPEQAFPARLERKLKEQGYSNVQVINMSVRGDTTAQALERFHAVQAVHPDVVVVELGANDTFGGIKVSIIYRNLATMLQALMADKVYVVLIGIRAPSSMGYEYGAQLDASFRQLANDYHAALYPYALDGITGRQDMTLADGMHPNAKGVEIMIDHIYPLVDAGVRWKVQLQQYQQNYQQYIQQQKQGAPPPPPVQ